MAAFLLPIGPYGAEKGRSSAIPVESPPKLSRGLFQGDIMRKLFVAATILALFTAGSAFAKTIRIGVTPGPHAQIMEKVKEVAEKNGLEIDIQEFSDYVIPNMALADGALEANSFQHKPYLDNQVADRGFDIVSVAETVNFP